MSRITLSVSLALFVHVLTCTDCVLATTYQVTQLTNDIFRDDLPEISGDDIVWRRDLGSTWGVFLYDGTSTTQLSTVSSNVDISGDNVVWDAGGSIHFYDGVSTTPLSVAGFSSSGPRISGNNIAWKGSQGLNGDEVFFHDGSTTTRLTNDSFDDRHVRISGSNVVWEGFDGNDWEIFHYDGSTVTQLTNNDYDDFQPQVSGGNVAWRADPGTSNEIFFYDGTTTTQMTNDNQHDGDVAISGDTLVWHHNDGDDLEIMLYDGTSITQLTSNDEDDAFPQIDGNNVVWHHFRDGSLASGEIFAFDGSTTTRVTDNATPDTFPRIDGDTIGWRGDLGNDFEVFIGTAEAPVAPTASSNASLSTSSDIDVLILDFGTVQQFSDASPLVFPIANLVSSGVTAGLEFVGVTGTGDTSELSTNIESLNTYLTDGGSLSPGLSLDFEAAIDTAAAGDYDASYQISFTDALGTDQTITLNVEGLVANIDDPNRPNLIYDSLTGEVIIEADSVGVIAYELQNGLSSFIAGNHTPILGGFSTSLPGELSEFNIPGLTAGQTDSLGNVFPTGLDLAGLNALLTVNTVTPDVLLPAVPFDLVVLGSPVPEPTTYVMAALGLMGLGFVGWRCRGARQRPSVTAT